MRVQRHQRVSYKIASSAALLAATTWVCPTQVQGSPFNTFGAGVVHTTTSTTVQVQTTPTPTTAKTPPVNIPTLLNNVLTPVDQNQGATGASLANKLGHQFLLPPIDPGQLPQFIRDLPIGVAQNLSVEDIPLGATIIDADADSDGSHLVPIAYKEGGKHSYLTGGVSNPGLLVLRNDQKPCQYAIFSNHGGILADDSFGSKNATVVGAPGTVLTTDNAKLTLQCGSILITSANEPVRVATKVGGMKIEPHTTAFVQNSLDHVTVVSVIKAQAPDAIKFRSQHEPDQVRGISEGQQALLADATLNPNLKGQFSGGGKVLVTKDLSDDIKAGLSDFATPSLMTTPLVRQLCAGQLVNDTKGTKMHAQRPCLVYAAAGSAFAALNGELHVYYGKIFVAPASEETLSTSFGQMHCAPGALVCLWREPGVQRLQVLESGATNDFLIGSTNIWLDQGQELFLSDHYPYQNEAVPADNIGRRQFHLAQVNAHALAIISDFSIYSTLAKAAQLNGVRKPTCLSNRQMLGQLLKVAVAQQYATGGRGQFMVAQSQTASSAAVH
jgi:hypothetical protein